MGETVTAKIGAAVERILTPCEISHELQKYEVEIKNSHRLDLEYNMNRKFNRLSTARTKNCCYSQVSRLISENLLK